MSATNDETDAELALRLAIEAGQHLLELRHHGQVERLNPWTLRDRGDQLSHRFIGAELRRLRPDDAVLDEEGAEDPRRFQTDRVWIIDPLDGTREYGEAGRSDWAVHIALWSHGRFEAGAVSVPALGEAFATDPAPVAPTTNRQRPRLVTSRNRVPSAAAIVAHHLDCDAVRLGSAGAKAMAVIKGLADIYVHDSGMYQWDSAAPVAVAQAAGLHTSRVDGNPLIYNERSAWLPDVLICRPEYAAAVLTALATEYGPTRP